MGLCILIKIQYSSKLTMASRDSSPQDTTLVHMDYYYFFVYVLKNHCRKCFIEIKVSALLSLRMVIWCRYLASLKKCPTAQSNWQYICNICVLSTMYTYTYIYLYMCQLLAALVSCALHYFSYLCHNIFVNVLIVISGW